MEAELRLAATGSVLLLGFAFLPTSRRLDKNCLLKFWPPFCVLLLVHSRSYVYSSSTRLT